jgi:pimeloyl-ACP methyl ester carboxylesterase
VPGADGRPITVTEQGQGPAVLLLHPGSADRSSWARVAAALAGRFRVLRFDRWIYRDGHAAGSPAGADAMAAEVHDVLAVAAAAGERPLLVGHSSARWWPSRAPGRTVGLPGAGAVRAAGGPCRAAGGGALRRARAALDAGDPDRAITIHMREIVGAGRLMVAALRRVPPVWQVVRDHAPAQITDDEAIESLGVGLAATPAWTCPCCFWAAVAARRTCGNGSTRWPRRSPGRPRWSSWRGRATWPTCAPLARSPR